MNLNTVQKPPKVFYQIEEETKSSGFSMASDELTGSLLRTLAASKPGARFLELGTGTGLATSWILDGMDAKSKLTSIDNDEKFLSIARKYLGYDDRLSLVLSDGGEWVSQNVHEEFDYIFADTWHGKYIMLDEVLKMLSHGGLYIVDDMIPQPNWPEGHAGKADAFTADLESRSDLVITKQTWATGIIICTKR